MKKNYLLISLLLVLVLCACGSPAKKEKNKQLNEQVFLQKTLETSRNYIALRLETDNILMTAKEYATYEEWDRQMTKLIDDWKNFETKSRELEKISDNFSKQKVSLNFVNKVHAFSNQEINNIFDNAPAGKKIKTLATFLGVDAKYAYKILQQTQNEVQADAWNEAGNTFQKLETAAVVIKDTCKVGGFVGGVVLSGGLAGIASSGVIAQTAAVVSGADLVLEVTGDAANISLGNNNKVTEIIGDIRVITEPAAAILAIADMPKNVSKGVDKLNVWMFGADSFNSIVQEGKVIGIKLPVHERGEDDKEIGMTIINSEDIEVWLEQNNYKRSDGDVKEIMSAYEYDNNKKEAEEDDKQSSNETGIENTSSVNAIELQKNVSIISPVEESFQKGQARMWSGEISNFERDMGGRYVCNWNFYLDGVKYQEMKDTCSFTSTFIEKTGTLTAELKVDFFQIRLISNDKGEFVERVEDLVNTISSTKEYRVLNVGEAYVK